MSVLTCPVCRGAMREISHEGVAIDTCVQCRGVWLDRGELEKIATAIGGGGQPPATQSFLGAALGRHQPPVREDRGPRRDDDDDDDHRRGGDRRTPPSRTSRFLDFFD